MPKSSRATTVFPIVVRELRVLRVTDLTPGMRRITLTGEQLGPFTSAAGYRHAAFNSPGFDDVIRLIFPYPGETEPVLPVQREFDTLIPKDRRPLAKAYTVRRYDPATLELDVDFVKHGTGVATTWAYRAAPGDRIHLGGPSTSRAFPTGQDWLLVAGDATALPAIARMLEEAPEDLRAQVFIEIAEDDHRQELRVLPGVTVSWVSRDGAAAGRTTQLLDAVRKAEWWPGTPFAWVAGEQATARDIRRHLVEDRAMPKPDVEFTGYWRLADVVALAEDAAIPDPERTATPFDTFHDLAELFPPVAIRTAVALGVGDLISRGVTSVEAIAEAAGCAPGALLKLLRYLHTIDILTETAPGHYGLTEVGEFLATEGWINVLHPDSPTGRRELAIRGLLESVRTGQPVHEAVTGQSFDALRREQWFEDRMLTGLATFAPFVAEPLAKVPALEGVEHLVIHGPTAGVLAAEITAVRPRTRITICALPAQADWLRRDLPASIPDASRRDAVTVVEQSHFEPTPACDAVLLAHTLSPLPDADAAHVLRRAAENLGDTGRVLVLEDTFDTSALDEHDGEADLMFLTNTGGGRRTPDELEAIVGAAGLTVDRVEQVGWRDKLRVLR